MPIYEYECQRCGTFDCFNKMSNAMDKVRCPTCSCFSERILSTPVIHGTRDSFGIGNEFVDEKTGDVIDNWKSWEKHGYRKVDRKDMRTEGARKGFEDKKEELKGKKLRQLKPDQLPL